MSPNVSRALARLRDPDDPALEALARLMVEQTTATPLRDIARPRWLAGQIATALEAATRGDLARGWVERRIAAERERWSADARPLRSLVPGEVDVPLRRLLGREVAPDEELTFRILDQPAIRGLVREVLAASLKNFRQKVSSAQPTVLSDVGERAARRGRGLLDRMRPPHLGGLGDNVRGVAGNVRGVAENLVGAVRDEVESSLDGRVREYVRGVTTETVRGIAAYVAAEEHAAGFAELRLSVLDVILDTEVRVLADEADKLGPEELVDVIVGALRSAVGQDDFVDRAEARIAQVLDEAGDGTLGAWLDEVGLREVWVTTTTELLGDRLRAVVLTEPFAEWWAALLG